MSPYRSSSLMLPEPRPLFLVRWWRKLVGKLVYGGSETCGHCKYWKEGWKRAREMYWSSAFNTNMVRHTKIKTEKGDCRLMYGEEDTALHDTCDRFRPRRRYMHRVKS